MLSPGTQSNHQGFESTVMPGRSQSFPLDWSEKWSQLQDTVGHSKLRDSQLESQWLRGKRKLANEEQTTTMNCTVTKLNFKASRNYTDMYNVSILLKKPTKCIFKRLMPGQARREMSTSHKNIPLSENQASLATTHSGSIYQTALQGQAYTLSLGKAALINVFQRSEEEKKLVISDGEKYS